MLTVDDGGYCHKTLLAATQICVPLNDYTAAPEKSRRKRKKSWFNLFHVSPLHPPPPDASAMMELSQRSQVGCTRRGEWGGFGGPL